MHHHLYTSLCLLVFMFQLPVQRTMEFTSVVELLYLISYLSGPFAHIMHGCGSVLRLVWVFHQIRRSCFC